MVGFFMELLKEIVVMRSFICIRLIEADKA